MAAQLQVVRNTPPEERPRPEMVRPGAGFVEKFAKGRSRNEVVKVLLNGIARYAGLKEFSKAEQLREKMIEAVPTAIAEIIEAAEIIEKERAAAMDYEKIKVWADLFNKFTPGEATAFYYMLKDFSVRARQIVFQQGDCDNRLYFIASGCFKLSCYDAQIKKSIVYGNLSKGDACGADAFFGHSTHATTATALEDSKISCLEKREYQKLIADHPAIEKKLIAYCETRQKQFVAPDSKSLERRAHPRHSLALKAIVQRIDKFGTPSANITEVTLSDISAGGLCYIARDMGIGDAASLNQSSVQVSVSYQTNSMLRDFTKIAKVISVRRLPTGECSVHLEFVSPLSESKVFEIAQDTNIPTYF